MAKSTWYQLIMSLLVLSLLPASSRAVEVRDIRIKPAYARADIVFDLDEIPTDAILSQLSHKQISLEFSGSIASALKTGILDVTDKSVIKNVAAKELNDSVQLLIDLTRTGSARMYPLHFPERLVLSIQSPLAQNTTERVEPGLIHKRLSKNSERGPLNINILEFDPRQSRRKLVMALASETNGLHETSGVRAMVERFNGVAGINAAYFKPDTGTTLGTTVMDSVLVAGPVYNRVVLGVFKNNTVKMARVELKGQLSKPNAPVIKLHNVNQPRLSKAHAIVYTQNWGELAPETPVGGVQLQIVQNKIKAISTERLPIIPNGYVVVLPDATAVATYGVGDTINIALYTTPDWSSVMYALSAGPFLLKDGQKYVDSLDQQFNVSYLKPAPRTAVGLTANNTVLLVTVDGRQDESVGLTLDEMASLMKELGAITAMNFDGGSSTQMVVKGVLVNSPTVTGAARVGSAIIIK
jgi:hypothetical protein